MPEPPIPPAAPAAAPTPIQETALEPIFILPSELGSPLPMPEEPQLYRIPAEDFLGLAAEPAVIAKPQPEPAPIQEKIPASMIKLMCNRCHVKRPIIIETAKSRGKTVIIKGKCSVCGCGMSRIVKGSDMPV